MRTQTDRVGDLEEHLATEMIPGSDLARPRQLSQRLLHESAINPSRLYDLRCKWRNAESPPMVLKATTYLKANPDKAVDLIPLFEAKLGLKGRDDEDLLAGVGHTSAQAAMVSILSDERTQSTSHFIRLVQSTSLLLEPELETIEFLGDLTSTMNAPLGRAAAAVSFGAGIARLSAHGHKDDADRLNADLNAML